MSDVRKNVRLVIADDHPIVLEGIAKVLEAEADFVICAKCSNGTDALHAIREHRPDVGRIERWIPVPCSSERDGVGPQGEAL